MTDAGPLSKVPEMTSCSKLTKTKTKCGFHSHSKARLILESSAVEALGMMKASGSVIKMLKVSQDDLYKQLFSFT